MFLLSQERARKISALFIPIIHGCKQYMPQTNVHVACFIPIASSNANKTVLPSASSSAALFPIHLNPVKVS